jgi:twitching motility two-component system response regulator PilH
MDPIDNALQGWKVAVIDDEPDSLEVVSMILEMHGATVETANNGEAGLELIRTTRPDLIISDLSMPGLSGWELVEKIKHGDRALADIPVIALTAHAMEKDRRWAIASGFFNFITKPLFVKQVITLLAVDHPELRVYLNETA